MKHYKIYALVDPRTLEPRYVGATTCPPQRRLHFFQKHKGKLYGAAIGVRGWINELKDIGLEPRQIILESSPADGIEAEVRWIAKFRQSGMALFNIAHGGLGTKGLKHTEKWKRDNAKRMKGKIKSPETCAKISASKIGKPRPDLASRNKLGRKLSDDQVRAIRALANKGELSMSKIGKLFGTNAVMVHALKHRTKYKDVT